jgi:hypothetical protein
MCATDSTVPVCLLPVPVISGPTIGVSLWDEGTEWGRQIRRWIVGSSESFHYFIIHWRGRPLFAGVLWFFMFFMYYGVLLCSAGLFSALASIPLPWVTYPSVPLPLLGVELSLSLVGLLALGLQYLAFAAAFLIDRWAVRSMSVREEISPLRNLLHWLLAPPTLFLYSVIAFYAICRFVFAGKVMARHDMAGKEGLGSVAGAAAGAAASSSAGRGEEEELPSGGELGDDIAAFYPSSGADRKTSRDRLGSADAGSLAGALARHARSSGGGAGAGGGDGDGAISLKGVGAGGGGGAAAKGGEALLCELPEKFFFGSYSTEVLPRDKNV